MCVIAAKSAANMTQLIGSAVVIFWRRVQPGNTGDHRARIAEWNVGIAKPTAERADTRSGASHCYRGV